MKLAIGIPFKDRAEFVIRLVRSLLDSIKLLNLDDISVRIFLINDHSQHFHLKVVKDIANSCRGVYLVDNNGLGPGAARNTIYGQLSDEDYVAFIDCDCLPDKNWILEICRVCEKFRPSVLQGVPFLYMKKNKIGEWEENLYQCMFSTYLNPTLDSCNMTDSRNLIVSKSFFSDMSGKLFSEKLNKAAAESRVLMARIKERNISVAYSEYIKVFHQDPVSIVESCLQKYRHGHGRVEIWGANHPPIEQLLKRYFYDPISLNIPSLYVISVHLSFLYGYFSNMGNMTVFEHICRRLRKDYEGINLFDVLNSTGAL